MDAVNNTNAFCTKQTANSSKQQSKQQCRTKISTNNRRAIKGIWTCANHACHETIQAHWRNGFSNYTSSFKERKSKSGGQRTFRWWKYQNLLWGCCCWIEIKRAIGAASSKRIKLTLWNTRDNVCSNGIRVIVLLYQSRNKCIYSKSGNWKHESNWLETTRQKAEASETHTIPQHWTKTSCGYLDWNRLHSVTLFLEEIKRDPRGPITQWPPLFGGLYWKH